MNEQHGDRRIECTVCYFEEEFDHEPCGIAWCSCPCNARQEGWEKYLAVPGAGSKGLKAAADFNATLRSVEATLSGRHSEQSS